MRLTPEEITVIRDTILKYDPEAKVYLFGSRADNNKKGGDIDLLVFSKVLKYSDKIKIKARLFDKIGPQKIDLVITENDEKPFVKIALKRSVPIWPQLN